MAQRQCAAVCHATAVASELTRPQPIENAWALMKTRIARDEPKNQEELEAVVRAWNAVMTPEYRQTLADSMRRRLTAVHAANGAPIKY